ncbi:ion channel [Lithospermum erythrorhizon]|uniref:Mechanosensitive ion channel protein n=1 Tax=Lithospermum erythrorhizon TaxID=34254 RepID=A0AAV3RM62_LITER
MLFPYAIKKSFKKKHSRKISLGDSDEDTDKEQQQPILGGYSMMAFSSDDPRDRREVILKIDGSAQPSPFNNNSGGRNFMQEGGVNMQRPKDGNNVNARQRGKDILSESPPTMLIGEFLKNQKAAGLPYSFDVDLEMNELNSEDNSEDNNSSRPSNLNERLWSSKEARVAFLDEMGRNSAGDIEGDDKRGSDATKADDSSSGDDDEGRRRSSNVASNVDIRSNYSNSPRINRFGGDDQVLRCTSFQRRDNSRMLGHLKSKSRLMDNPDLPPLPPSIAKSEKIQKSGTIRSGILSRTSGTLGNEEEDDPLFDEDIPDDFKNGKIDSLTILQWLSLILIVSALACSLLISKWKEKSFRGLKLWKWEVLTLVVICGRLVSGWVIKIVVFLVERNFMLRKRVLYFVYGVRKAVQNCLWLGLVLIAWHFMFDKRVEAHNQFLLLVNKLMVCMVVATLLWLVKTLMVKVLASSFHVSRFFDRIQDSLFNQYVIETLSGPPLIEIRHRQDEEEKTIAEVRQLQNAGVPLPPDLKVSAFRSPALSGRLVGTPGQKQIGRGLSFKNQEEQAISIDHLHRLNPKNVSAWNMKRLMNIVRYGAISTLDEQVLSEANEDENTKQIRNECEAKVAARKIFINVAKPGAKFIHLEDLIRFLREEEAIKAINNVEGSSQSTKISKVSLKNWVVNTFRERRALALTLNDTKTAVKKLHQMVNVLVGVIIIILCAVILGFATSKVLLFMSSQVVVMAFIFGNTCKTAFEAIIFLFVMHPFDVGDRCEIDGVQMVVEEMNILNTIFLRFDNQKVMFPNSTLATKPIGNYNRSPDMGDAVDFHVHITTPPEKIALLKQRIISYIENKKDCWYEAPLIVLMDLADIKTLKYSVWARQKINYQDMGERYIRRALLVDEMVKIFKELDIEYRLYPMDINIRTMPPPTSSRVPTTWQGS